MVTVQLQIDGMHCAKCVERVTQGLKGVSGETVEAVEVGSAKVRLDESVAQPDALVKALEKMGFDAKITAA